MPTIEIRRGKRLVESIDIPKWDDPLVIDIGSAHPTEIEKLDLNKFPVGNAKILNFDILLVCVVREKKDLLSFYIVDE